MRSPRVRGDRPPPSHGGLVYFGLPIHPETDGGIEGITEQLLDMESAIIDVLRMDAGWRPKHIETITDEDRIAALKLMAVRCEVEG